MYETWIHKVETSNIFKHPCQLQFSTYWFVNPTRPTLKQPKINRNLAMALMHATESSAPEPWHWLWSKSFRLNLLITGSKNLCTGYCWEIGPRPLGLCRKDPRQWCNCRLNEPRDTSEVVKGQKQVATQYKQSMPLGQEPMNLASIANPRRGHWFFCHNTNRQRVNAPMLHDFLRSQEYNTIWHNFAQIEARCVASSRTCLSSDIWQAAGEVETICN